MAEARQELEMLKCLCFCRLLVYHLSVTELRLSSQKFPRHAECTIFIYGKEILMAKEQDSGFKTPVLSPEAHSGPYKDLI